MTALPTGTVTLLLADVEGSTRLWETEPEVMAAALARLEDVLVEVLGRHDGARPLEQGEGDSFVAAFTRASDAVAAALDLQLAELAPLRLRIGIHTAEVQLRDDDQNYMGPAMNRTARLRDLGHGGQSLLSQATHDIVVDALPGKATLTDLGTHRLKDLARPERVHQLGHPELPSEFPPLRSVDAYPNNLPVQLTSFIGRDRELEELRQLIGDHRLVTLTGSGGAGKTRLALQLAADVLDDHPDGVWWVDLAPIGDPELVPGAFAEAMGLREVPGEAMVTTLARVLSTRHSLVVIDNGEHLVDATASLAHHLLQSCLEVTLLATSREPLGVDGEAIWRVPSLEVPQADAGSDVASGTDAVRLFVERATRARPSFVMDDTNTRATVQICTQLDGIPLAIELAAARVRVMAPPQIAAALDDRFRLLAGGSRTALPRQRTLEASVDWSHNLLPPEHRILFRRLSVFAGTFALDSAEAVCAGDGLDANAVLELLLALVDRSLVQPEDDGRFRLLETIRHYGRQKLIDSGESDTVRTRHLAHYRDLIERAAPEIEGGNTAGWVRRLVLERDNIRTALDWSLASDNARPGLALAIGWPSFWGVLAATDEGLSRIGLLIAAVQPRGADRAAAEVALANIELYRAADISAAMQHADEAIALGRELGDRRIQARGLLWKAWSTSMIDPTGAGVWVQATLAAAREAGDRWSADQATICGAQARLNAGDYAGVSVVQGLLDSPSGLDLLTMREALFLLGSAITISGRPLDGDEHLRAAIAIADEVGDRHYYSRPTGSLGIAAYLRGDYEASRPLVDAQIRGASDVGNQVYEGFGYAIRAALERCIGDHRAAAADAARAIEIIEPIGVGFGLSFAHTLAAWAAMEQGDLDLATEHLDRSLAVGLVSPPFIGVALAIRARLDRSRGDLVRAEESARAAVVSMGPTFAYTPESLETLAGVLAAREEADKAARLLGAAAAIRERQGLARAPSDQVLYDADAAMARAALGDEAFEAAWADGAALSAEEAVAYATRGRGERKRPTAGWDSLTPAELEVVRLVAEGLPNKEIAARLFISPRTVQAHLTHVYAKVGVSSRVQLATEAAKRS